jgi:succinylglutamate desuccinylase
VLPGPALIHLPGRRIPPLFVSVLLHGNEDTGWLAAQSVLKKYATVELPRALSLFIGNVEAARTGLRRLDGQPDYNRVWPGSEEAHPPKRR